MGPGERAKERKWWDYAWVCARRTRGDFLPLSAVNCPDLQGLQGWGYLILVPSNFDSSWFKNNPKSACDGCQWDIRRSEEKRHPYYCLNYLSSANTGNVNLNLILYIWATKLFEVYLRRKLICSISFNILKNNKLVYFWHIKALKIKSCIPLMYIEHFFKNNTDVLGLLFSDLCCPSPTNPCLVMSDTAFFQKVYSGLKGEFSFPLSPYACSRVNKSIQLTRLI